MRIDSRSSRAERRRKMVRFYRTRGFAGQRGKFLQPPAIIAEALKTASQKRIYP